MCLHTFESKLVQTQREHVQSILGHVRATCKNFLGARQLTVQVSPRQYSISREEKNGEHDWAVRIRWTTSPTATFVTKGPKLRVGIDAEDLEHSKINSNDKVLMIPVLSHVQKVKTPHIRLDTWKT